MPTFATAVPVSILRRYPRFDRGLDSSSPLGQTLFVHEDYVVRTGASRGSREVFRDDSPSWLVFCDNRFQLEGPPAPPLHEWNKGFTWRPVTGPSRILDEAARRQYNDDGYCILENAVPQEKIEQLIGEVDRLERAGEARLRRMEQGRAFIARADEITFTTHIVRNSRPVSEFYRSRLFCDIVLDLVGPDVRLYWDQAVYKKPNSPYPFPWHQDNGYTFVDPQQYLTCWIALSDSDESNGGLQMVPGQHRQGTFQHRRTSLGYVCYDETPATARSLETKAGTIVCMAATTPHQTGANLTGEVRRALVAQFAPDGAVAVTREANGRVVRLASNDPIRQFEIIAGGRPVV